MAALATALLGATSTAAHADYYSSGCRTTSSDPGGLDCWVMFWDEGIALGGGEFQSYGEKLFAYDSWADGRGVYVEAVWWQGGLRWQKSIKLTSGANTSRTLDLGDINEGIGVSFTSCQTDEGSLLNCRTQKAVA
ncbi:hypothetical protein [Micromonospora arida]|uniref:Uncharacterized protein n=1 Tax=Micromonospora arida TaxID=2203715 RepID=A0A3N9WJW9_9ACTN|nr:hypothetical protein [Micromonospora arida]RQX01245.1 hypothetical protein DLJ58_33040 [Micromonospora arida]